MLDEKNDDGAVNVDDLLQLLQGWGPCPAWPDACAADITPGCGDDVVNVDDLLVLLANWGA